MIPVRHILWRFVAASLRVAAPAGGGGPYVPQTPPITINLSASGYTPPTPPITINLSEGA